MDGLSKETYEQMVADCDDKCVISEEMLTVEPDLMKCVRCPFCTQIVDAIVTDSQISCPACKVTVGR